MGSGKAFKHETPLSLKALMLEHQSYLFCFLNLSINKSCAGLGVRATKIHVVSDFKEFLVMGRGSHSQPLHLV